MIFGPKRIVLVVGRNKIVTNVKEGPARIMNSLRHSTTYDIRLITISPVKKLNKSTEFINWARCHAYRKDIALIVVRRLVCVMYGQNESFDGAMFPRQGTDICRFG